MRVSPRLLAYALVTILLLPASANARGIGAYRLPLEDEVRSVHLADVDNDGREDVLVLARATAKAGQPAHDVLWILSTPAQPTPRTYFPEDARTRLPLTGELARMGAVTAGRFGPRGAIRLRFFGARGAVDLDVASGTRTPLPPARKAASQFERSPSAAILWWDGVADLDGDGRDECWVPTRGTASAMRVLAGDPSKDVTLSLAVNNRAHTSIEHAILRRIDVPTLQPVDLDGDGQRELMALRAGALLAWSLVDTAEEPRAPAFRLPLPFLERPEGLGPEMLYAPRLQLDDVDGDGKTDLLVTLISGRSDRIGSLRTTFVHYPGPFRNPDTGVLVPMRARIDTESVALHPQFVDLDGDGAKDYVGDSIRSRGIFELIPRLMGQDPEIHMVGFQFDKRAGTFRETPWFTMERTYPSAEALSNRFGINAMLSGDFDGDKRADLLDLTNLEAVTVLKGSAADTDAWAFAPALLPAIPTTEPLAADARVGDLNADGRSDAVLWSEKALYLLVPKGDA